LQFLLEMKIRGRDGYADHVVASFDGPIDILLDDSAERLDLGIKSQIADHSCCFCLCRGATGKPASIPSTPISSRRRAIILFIIGGKDLSPHLFTVAKAYTKAQFLSGEHL
jgi:hypothetical protein